MGQFKAGTTPALSDCGGGQCIPTTVLSQERVSAVLLVLHVAASDLFIGDRHLYVSQCSLLVLQVLGDQTQADICVSLSQAVLETAPFLLIPISLI